jgi:DNA modification methylase
VKLSQIYINPNNPRIIKDDRFLKLVKSISEFPKMMELRPIIVDSDMMILGGNMRFKALKELKYKDIPDTWVKRADELTEEEKQRFIIEDNIPFGEWDWDTLANEWDQDKLIEWGLDIPDFVGQKLEAQEDDYEIPGEIKTDIVLGDLFEIGSHRLLCGDSTDSKQVELLMNQEKADLVFTDPPYGVNYSKTNAAKSSRSRSRSVIEGDQMNVKEISEVLWRPSFKNLYESSKDDCSFYMTMCQGGDQMMMMMMMMMMMSENWQVKHELIWVKSSPVFSMGRLDYDYKHEPIIYGWKKKHNFYGKGEFIKSVWEIPKPSKSDDHPTMKPVALIANALQNSSKDNDLIIDFFLGSGTTMVASHQLKRKCYGIEIDPKYCQVILDRMRKLDPEIIIKKNGVLI